MSSNCTQEAHDHDHHSHGHDHDHDHDHDSPDRGAEFSLYQNINTDLVTALNEVIDGSCKKIFKPWDRRLDITDYLESDTDPQILLFIPFTGTVKLKSIAIKTVPGSDPPTKMKAFINRDNLDFESAESINPADGEWDLVNEERESIREPVEYQTKLTKFGNVRCLTLFFDGADEDKITKISYIGLKGEWTEVKKDPIITLYEAAANPADHKKLHADAPPSFNVQ